MPIVTRRSVVAATVHRVRQRGAKRAAVADDVIGRQHRHGPSRATSSPRCSAASAMAACRVAALRLDQHVAAGNPGASRRTAPA
jgi:hypothetical protein